MGGRINPPEADTICGIGNRKNLHFLKYLETNGAEAYVTTIEFIRSMRSSGKGVALISASRNAKNVLRLSGLMDLFDVIVDGMDSQQLGIYGKPAPDIFLEAARRLGTVPRRSAIVEDALAGVEAGRSGGFGLVIGLDRGSHEGELREHGADVVVKDLLRSLVKRRSRTSAHDNVQVNLVPHCSCTVGHAPIAIFPLLSKYRPIVSVLSTTSLRDLLSYKLYIFTDKPRGRGVMGSRAICPI